MRSGGLRRAAVLLAVVATGCAGPVESAIPSATTAASPSPAGSASEPSATGSASPSGPTIVVDDRLLDVLPAQVDGIDLVSDPATAAGIASDPALATTASAIAVALAVAPDASTGDDIAVVSVVQLRPDVFGDAWYRAWRDTYDDAACAAAGGVTGNAQAEIGGHDTYIGTCVQGAFTYHVYLEDLDRLVSITSAGDRRLGERIVSGLGE